MLVFKHGVSYGSTVRVGTEVGLVSYWSVKDMRTIPAQCTKRDEYLSEYDFGV